MIMEVYAVFDKKVNAYMNPQFFRTRGEALRAWMDAVHAEAAPFRRHAEDYVFCRLGVYNDSTGEFACVSPPELSMSAVDCLTVDGSVN